MSKTKEHFHEEICEAQAGANRDYAVDSMKKVTDATNAWISGKITISNWYNVILTEVKNFENMHEPWQPK